MKVLFVLGSANIGGSTTSLCNMLDLLIENDIKADVYLMAHTGELLNTVKKKVFVFPENRFIASAVCNQKYLKEYGLLGLLIRGLVSVGNKLRTSFVTETLFKFVASKIIGYDVVIAYQETYATDFAKYISSKKKIAWVHTIYSKFVVSYKTQRDFSSAYEKYDSIVCVAEAALKALCEGAPFLSKKVLLIPNPLIPEKIIEKSNEMFHNDYINALNNECVCIVSVGRLSVEKQYDLAVKVASNLNALNKSFIWFIAGEGDERGKIQELIKNYRLEKKVILLGLLSNPFPLIKRADLLVISSVYEAQPMVANEALILGTPVITTNYPTAYTLINDRYNGLICDNSIESLTNALVEYIDNETFAATLKRGASTFVYNDRKVIDEVIKLIKI